MHVLFISTSIPPYPDMQAIRNIFLIKGLETKGYDVSVVTAEYFWNKDDLTNELSGNTRIYKTSVPVLIRLSKFLESHKSLKLFSKVFNVLVNYIAIPDIHMFWNLQVKKLCRKLAVEGNKYDLIITSSGSYTSHYIGNWLSEKWNIPWIAEYGDPWGVDIYGNIKKINYMIEKRLIRNCRGMVFTTQATLNVYSNLYGATKQYCLIPCGYENVINDVNTNSKKLVLGYTGVAYSASRNLMPAIESVAKSEKNVNLNIIGSYSSKYKNYVETIAADKINFTGRVAYQKSLEMIGEMDALLHIGNFGTLQIPGKTYIYLSSKKPIIYIQQEEKNDPTYSVLKNFDGIIFCKNNTDSITKAINELADNYALYKGLSENRVNSNQIGKYQWKSIADNFAEFIGNFINI